MSDFSTVRGRRKGINHINRPAFYRFLNCLDSEIGKIMDSAAPGHNFAKFGVLTVYSPIKVSLINFITYIQHLPVSDLEDG